METAELQVMGIYSHQYFRIQIRHSHKEIYLFGGVNTLNEPLVAEQFFKKLDRIFFKYIFLRCIVELAKL